MIRALLTQVRNACRGYSEADIASLDAKLISSVTAGAGQVTWLSAGEMAALRDHHSRFIPGPRSQIAEAI